MMFHKKRKQARTQTNLLALNVNIEALRAGEGNFG